MDSGWLNSVFDDYALDQDDWGTTPLPVGTVIEVVDRNEPHQEGDMRTDLYIVIKVVRKGEEAYFRKTGFYASWDGGHWDGPWVEVNPISKSVTQWEETDTDYDSFDSYD